jgi:hypothetical protein
VPEVATRAIARWCGAKPHQAVSIHETTGSGISPCGEGLTAARQNRSQNSKYLQYRCLIVSFDVVRMNKTCLRSPGKMDDEHRWGSEFCWVWEPIG